MTDPPEPPFTPEEFEERKFTEYFPKLQQAYKTAFQDVNETYDSELVHAIDQTVLNESEPVYEGNGEFRIDLPDNPHGRIAESGVLVGEDRAEKVLAAYINTLEHTLQETFAPSTN